MKIVIESKPDNTFNIQADGTSEDDPIEVIKVLLNATKALTDALPKMERSPIVDASGKAGLRIVDKPAG